MKKIGWKRRKSIFFAALACASTLLSMTAGTATEVQAKGRNVTHGTTSETITEDMVDNTVPSDYKIDSSMQADAKDGKYMAYFLEDELQTVEITIDENNLNYILQNADEKPSALADSVTIGGETIYYCGFKTKGNYTLAHTYSDEDSDRFSFTINFGKYVKKADYGETQNFYGLSKVSFNNFFFDKTMMKEYFALKLMTEMGVPTPAYGLAKLYINGEYYGVYFMVESLDESILERTYGLDSSQVSDYLVKPTDTKLQYEELLEDDSPLYEDSEDTYEDVEEMLPTVMDWVEKLNQLSQGTDFDGNEIDVNSDEYLELLGQIIDVDEFVRYFATHSFLCQFDNMFNEEQNFGLYVSEDGVATMVPWDYDLSFGCYYPSDAESTANLDLDIMTKSQQPLATVYQNYPLFNVIYQNDSLRELMHTYMEDCSKIMALGGTTTLGKTYEPAYFAGYVDIFYDQLVAACDEELADNVSYLNWTSQPSDLKKGLPNLKKIMAMRSVGVYLQVEDIDAIVTGSGCDLSTLGNASQGWTSNDGTLATVDAATGIFAIADYRSREWGDGPTLTITSMDSGDTTYSEIMTALGNVDASNVLVYNSRLSASPTGDITLYIPLASDWAGDTTEIYTYYNGSLSPVTIDAVEDNLCVITLSQMGTLVIVNHSTAAQLRNHKTLFIILGAALLLVIALVLFLIIFRKKRKAKSSLAESATESDIEEAISLENASPASDPESDARETDCTEPDEKQPE